MTRKDFEAIASIIKNEVLLDGIVADGLEVG